METKPTNDTAARDAARKARAIAFVQEKPKAGKPWTSKTYEYEESNDEDRRMDRPSNQRPNGNE